jgi:SAM-dependent methyltransferase
MTDETDAQLAAQYEAYPYPKRDPREEAKRLIVGSPGHLREIDDWVFGATRPATLPLRALFAGGGTGDGAIMLAQQLATANRPGTVTWLDRSEAALAIAKARAEARGLTNIVFEQRSLLDLPQSGLGPFDYVDCCGVLHHLPDPLAGLQALVSVLAPSGGIGLMVYAPYGRTGVYMLQDALRTLAPPELAPAARLETARRLMRNLPETAWLRANRNFADHITGGDAGLYDLLLNPRDTAFTVQELASLVGKAGLAIAAWIEPMRYEPATWLQDAKLRARLDGMSPLERAAIAEQICGNMATHVIYCRRQSEPAARADPLAPEAVPIARELPAATMAQEIGPDGTTGLLFGGLRAAIALPRLAPAILRQIDGKRSVAEIAEALAPRATPAAFASAWEKTYTALNQVNRLLLAAPNDG